jgi:xylan 1,4-beta-xylosidase
MSCPGDYPDGAMTFPLAVPLPIAPGPVELRAEIDHARLQFSWRQGGQWQAIGPVLDAAVISDEGGRGEHGSFTGAFVGMFAMDITGQGREARFTRFAYKPG